ncbi:DNA polymerase III subunit epsilon [Corynebacterium sp. 13CS0277]|uniref:DNA polymerase III subunit epsilon n=1 Tax=Corynebacterium sp. 13CS0277 TaxID=2071994 RepID=UPI000D0417B5|nr:DNA polymerase III subunit epsilon [Corynebacterium sp. 13CS0277]PRQ12129.1 DNA polymerase III subunit epsilon [Corynebacterium sp. 13CS0277]
MTVYTVLTLLTTGIHPSTSRIVGVDAVQFDDAGTQVAELFSPVNPGEDIGPVHAHSFRAEDMGRAPRFASVSKKLEPLVDGSTLIVHNGPRTWGFLCTETHRAVEAARRQRRRKKPGVRRLKPETIVDTLASLRRQGVYLSDTRVAGCARTLGLDVSPVASVARSELSAAERARRDTQLVWWLYQRELGGIDPARPAAGAALVPAPSWVPVPKTPASVAVHGGRPVLAGPGVLSVRRPEELARDRFGLQRTVARVQAASARRPYVNPGVLEDRLVQGMEVVIAPEIQADPNDLLEAMAGTGLAYSEKLSRATSVVVCNEDESDPSRPLQGKAMHGARKGIPRVSDVEFLRLVRDVAPGVAAPPTTL